MHRRKNGNLGNIASIGRKSRRVRHAHHFILEGFIVTRASRKAVTSDACRDRKAPTILWVIHDIGSKTSSL